MVQIYIDDQEKFTEAINIIETEIRNIRDKVDILKIYGPKILKNSNNQKKTMEKYSSKTQNSDWQSERLMKLVQSIAEDVVALAMGNKDKAKLGYGPGQQAVKIEELLQIFVDHPDHLRGFLEYVINIFGEKVDFKKSQLTDINLHHRLLECYLYKNQSMETEKGEASVQPVSSKMIEEKVEIKKRITDFLKKNDGNGKIDKNYVLFLF